MRVGIVDCGTNTFNLLVAELTGKGYEILHASKIPVRIGKGGLNEGRILPDAEERAMEALRTHKETALLHGAGSMHIFATSALRNAENGKEIARRAKNELGLDIQIISGLEEASLIYEGVRLSGALDHKPALIMDIGGGSCEFIYGTVAGFSYSQSFEIGVSRLVDRFPLSNPALPQEINTVSHYLQQTLQPLFSAVHADEPLILVGSSGTFDTFKDMYVALHPAEEHNKPYLDLPSGEFARMYAQITRATLEERLQIPGMAAFRAEMMVASVIAVQTIMEHFDFPLIRTCAYSMKEGILKKVWNDVYNQNAAH